MTDPRTPLEWVEYLRSVPEVEAVGIAERYDTDPEGMRQRWLAKGFPAAEVDALMRECRELRSRRDGVPGQRILNWLREALAAKCDTIEDQEADEPPGEPMPRWPSGVPRIDRRTAGGCFGMTVISAPPKQGKSMVAVRSALEAARVGWRVLYFNAELTRTEMSNRLLAIAPRSELLALGARLSIHHVTLGLTPEKVIEKIQSRIDPEDVFLLVVMDSISRVVRSMRDKRGFFERLELWQEWFRIAAMVSEGRVGSLICSEIGASGESKGRSLEYAANLCITLSPVKNVDGVVEVAVPYSRGSAGGKLGEHLRRWRSMDFVYVGEETEEPEQGEPEEGSDDEQEYWEF